MGLILGNLILFVFCQLFVYIFFNNFRQSNEQDFSNLPDPFGSYRNKLSYKDFGPPPSIDPQSLGHIEDPQMQSLMEREIAR